MSAEQPPRAATPNRALVVAHTITQLFKVPLIIASFYFPLAPVRGMVDEIAGKQTGFRVDISFAVSFTLTLAGVSGLALWKMRRQALELRRARARITELEEELEGRREQGGGYASQ
jgi:hypothetical protein